MAQSAGAVEYTEYTSAEGTIPPMSVLERTKQYNGEVPVGLEFGECGVMLYCHYSQVHSGPDW